jgi:tetratricopeptide (TPR) repeat protein
MPLRVSGVGADLTPIWKIGMTRSTRTENRYAVCIGINKYQLSARLGTLSLAEGDAKAVHDLLGQSGFAPENLCLLLGEDATLDAINSALFTMILDRPGENDLVVFYFAGHSLPLTINEREVLQGEEPRSEVFLTSYDFDREKIKQFPSFRMQHALGMERLRTVFFEGKGSRKRLFIFDSCYSGDFYGHTYRDDQTTDPVQGYIRRLLDSKSTGRIALSSCLPIQKAAEDPRLGHGRFTNYLLEGLSGDPEALRHDGCVTVGSLFEYIAKKLPPEQRPVLSGVQHDIFELVCYPDKAAPTHIQAESEDAKRKEREARLHALLADHSGFMRSRVDSFVGRKQELKDIRHYIAEMLSTGGYLTITGRAGQGKSSIIAKLVEIYQQEYGPDNVAFHFIPLNSGPDHQIGILLKIMACLILKYNLPDFYVTSDSLPVLCEYFPEVLAKLAEQGGQEVIFIDGLDQLEGDATGVRDLSFLPTQIPQGVVFVLGTRPDDTLRPLELRKPRQEYQLPNLSKEDFDLMLQHQNVRLDSSLVERFYQAMQGNVLYLERVVGELMKDSNANPEMIIQKVADNPENIFSFTIERLMRQPLWESVMYPILGVLLTTHEPLAVRHIGQILGVADYKLREGLMRLGGLVAADEQLRYYLFHDKLQDYLRQDEKNPRKDYVFAKHEEQYWHTRLAQWCEGSDLALIWQDVKHDDMEQRRRVYARQHYITHLHLACEWQKLFAVLDEVAYGRAKLHYDPSTLLYAKDLDRGRQAATWDGWTLEQGIALLPRLWHYTFLRCSLTSRADSYPEATFHLLLRLGPEQRQKASELAEMLTDPGKKARIFAVIAEDLAASPERQREAFRLALTSADMSERLPDDMQKVDLLYKLADTIQRIGHDQKAEQMREKASKIAQAAHLDEKSDQPAIQNVVLTWPAGHTQSTSLPEETPGKEAVLSVAAFEAHEKARLEKASRVVDHAHDDEKAKALLAVSLLLKQFTYWGGSEPIWGEAERLISSLSNTGEKARALAELALAMETIGRSLFDAEPIRWEVIEVIAKFGDEEQRDMALTQFAQTLEQARYGPAIAQIWKDIESMIQAFSDDVRKGKALVRLVGALAWTGDFEEASRIVSALSDECQKAEALVRLGIALTRVRDPSEASHHIISILSGRHGEPETMTASALISGQFGRWNGVVALLINIIQTEKLRDEALAKLGAGIRQAGDWLNAENVINAIPDQQVCIVALLEHAEALIRAGFFPRAEHLLRSLPGNPAQLWALAKLGVARGQAAYRQAIGSEVKEGEQVTRKEFREAERVILVLPKSRQKSWALAELAAAFGQARMWQEAEATWKKAKRMVHALPEAVWEDPVFSMNWNQALVHFAIARMKGKHWKKVKRMNFAVLHDDRFIAALAEIAQGTEWGKDTKWGEYLEDIQRLISRYTPDVMDIVSNSQSILRVYANLGNAWKRKGDTESIQKAESIWQDAERLISNSFSSREQIRVLGEFARLLNETGNEKQADDLWQKSASMIRALHDNQDSIEALVTLAMELGKAGREAEARQLLLSLESAWRQIQELANLGTQAAQIGHSKQVRQVQQDVKDLLHKVAEDELGTEALAPPRNFSEQEEDLEHEQSIESLITSALDLWWDVRRREAEQQFKRIERIIRRIADETRRNEAWLLLVEARGRTRNWSEVERLKQEISPGRDLARFLALYGVLLGLAGRREEASKALESMADQASFDPTDVPILQDQARMKLAEEYWKEELWVDAELAIAHINDEHRRYEMLILCAEEAIQKERWQDVEQIVKRLQETISPGRNRAQFLAQCGVLLGLAGRRGEASQVLESMADQAIFDSIDIPILQDQAWVKLAEEYRKEELWVDAGLAILHINNEHRRYDLLILYAEEAIQKARWQEIKDFFTGLDTLTKLETFTRFGEIAVQNGLLAEAREICEEVEVVIGKGDYSSQYDKKGKRELFSRLGTVFERIGERQKAEAILQEVEEDILSLFQGTHKDQALAKLANALAQAKHWDEAKEVIEAIIDQTIKEAARSDLGHLLALTELWQEAQRVIGSIEENETRVRSLFNLINLLEEAQLWEQARQVAFTIQSDERLTRDMIQNIIGDDIDNIIENITKVEEEAQKYSEPIQEAGEEARRIPRAQTRVRESRPNDIERRALSSRPVPALPEAPGDSELIQSLREQWLEAKTEEQALERFALVCELIPHHPESGIQLWYAFKSVNNFLEALASAHTSVP